MKKPSVELKLPILPNMELIATQTAEVISRHMNLTEDQAGEICIALIEATINAFLIPSALKYWLAKIQSSTA